MSTKGTKASDRASKNFLIEENLRIAIQKEIENFISDDEMQIFQFPVSFTNTQRGFVHKFVQSKGLKSKSHGKGIAIVNKLFRFYGLAFFILLCKNS